MFSDADRQQIREHGLSTAIAEEQLQRFRRGFPHLQLIRPCTVDDGIIQLNDAQIETCEQRFDTVVSAGRFTKFVPASGAATRMFKELVELANDPDCNARLADKAPDDSSATAAFTFLDQIERFAFADELVTRLSVDGRRSDATDARTVLRAVLDNDGLNYATLPKGLILFHRYRDHVRTAAEEQLAETVACAGARATLHMTVSPEHQSLFERCLADVADRYQCDGAQPEIAFSWQNKATDTIAAEADNTPFRTPDGRLVFRPGGHGALLDNVQALEGDIVFLKNIDNIVPDSVRHCSERYIKVLCGRLAMLQDSIFDFLHRLEDVGTDSEAALFAEIDTFCENELFIRPTIADGHPKPDQYRQFLDRPIRVCGMVRNEGEPGGGPFWTRANGGSVAVQIVESSQVDMSCDDQRATWESSTHFNPVEIACGVRNFRGEPFELKMFRDAETGFIAHKSSGSRMLQALELPGLWNGAMAHWLTSFVEVPITTFNPVKTVLDLLRPMHQTAGQ